MNDESHVNDPDALLLDAASSCNYDLVKKLLSQGADINACNDQEETALFMAVDAPYMTDEARSEVVGLLLEHGADPNLSDVHGDTALDIVRYHKQNDSLCVEEKKHYEDIENVLLSNGARGKIGQSARGKAEDEREMEEAEWEMQKDELEMEEAMGQLEANKVRDGLYYGNELVEAVRCGDLERCKKIITLPVEEGGLLLLRYFGEDKQGNSALNLAAKNGHTEVVKLLLGQKCCADIKSVELARENGHQEIVALLTKSLKNGE